ncbi:hypothetical protein A2318_00815 [Candidatus Uhrbacteria bacterium RIFOXYB2_FULL_45_11]|uniref:Uncharacterized protein n=1 Tax=Candidatus Uhrbacteria bacterium RIFOXYB2_FULL_45_11 TaxID=1802421 RepID=A0A1F7W5B9_9BACT|nr:MAG: hypothetical protein A2318_00815 [Candidatus Uhrbacteria bacterium RIFOXYB2_FULL_45_11]
METLKRYFSKRYFLYFLFLFLTLYPGSFLLYVGYTVTKSGVLHVAMYAYFPILIFFFSFFYLRKSINDWNDRFIVAFGWIALTLIFSALLVPYVYGFDWTSIINFSQMRANWSTLLAVFLAGILASLQKSSLK